MQLERIGDADLPEVSNFLCSVFGLKEPAPNFQPDALRWKYFTPHPYWEGSRGYCLRYDGAMVAHGCVVPVRFVTPSGTATGCGVIDWAASPAIPGVGLLIYQLLYSSVDVFFAIGGSEAARKVIPKIGLGPFASMDVFVRVVNPLRDFQNRSLTNWKSAAHLARNTMRLLQRPGSPLPSGWSARRIHQFDERILAVLPERTGGVVCQRTPALLNYLLACPVTCVEAYAFYSDNSPAGYCLLSRSEGRCHVADIFPDNLPAAYTLALQLACGSPGVSEVIATASTAPVAEALVSAGFYRRESVPVFARDPKGLLAGAGPVTITSVEDDGFYL